jgi:trigger factor
MQDHVGEETMQVAIERRPGSYVALTVTVEPSTVEARLEQLFQKHAKRVTVPGFRPGKAPRRMLEERINRGALLQDAVESVIDTTYKTALLEQQIEPLERGEIEDLQTSDDLSVTYTVVVAVRPEITLPEYKGLVVTQPVTKVTDEQIEAEMQRLRERSADFAEIADEGIQAGDYVTIDYTMTLDGEAYPEGETTGYPLEVGTDTFFPELNEGLLGVKQGETTTLTTTYPDDYSDSKLAGKTATFEITVQQVRRVKMPEANDDWAKMISGGALESLDALRERLVQNLQAVAAQADRDHVRNELVRLVVEGATLELPDTLVDEEYEHLMHTLEHRLSHERMTLEEYAEAIDSTQEKIQNDRRLLAREMVRRSLVLQEIARRELLSVTDEDIDLVIAATNRDGRAVADVRKELAASGELNHLASRLFHEKVLGFLAEHAQITIEGAEAPAAEAPAEEAPKPKRRSKKATDEPKAE